ncbi:NUDIX hydrolase [Aeromicrobium sp. UC242_57]|uniref:NUDIX hydrolase n=1 Tax=Aeromicrobium sp. UC242_57 TaxID=3374624 RepID=UPI0037B6625A
MHEPSRTQRLGAYAVVLRDDKILLTRISPQGYPAGTWTLPGGGVDHGESPNEAVLRELTRRPGCEPCQRASSTSTTSTSWPRGVET